MAWQWETSVPNLASGACTRHERDMFYTSMPQTKYYDRKNDRLLNLESDGCALAEWEQLCGKRQFARHPKGFKIFISPERIGACDEYAESDPYNLEQNIDNEFHTRKKELTIKLLREAVTPMQYRPQILDLGCGQGHMAEKMRQAIDRAEFSGLDYSISAIEYAHEKYPRIDFAVGDANDCPYAKEFFDVVVCNNLWEHVPDPVFLLSGIRRILKNGGSLIVSTPSRYRVNNLVRVLKGKPVDFLSRSHVTEYTVGQVVEQLAYGGFRVKRILSRPISARNVKAYLVRWAFAAFIRLVGSHHHLESSVFYLAQKRESPKN
jgi:2-polyprenyl-3-methyl-5-hydroxy-6-metoxy-1,4-benzoquinol methylase